MPPSECKLNGTLGNFPWTSMSCESYSSQHAKLPLPHLSPLPNNVSHERNEISWCVYISLHGIVLHGRPALVRQPRRLRHSHQGSIVMHAMKRLNTLGFFCVAGCSGAAGASFLESFLVSKGLLILAV